LLVHYSNTNVWCLLISNMSPTKFKTHHTYTCLGR
jgi:hypothetical protein